MKTLVAFFSAESGRTASVAKTLATAIVADLFEIKPEKPYTSSDLNYMNPLARCNREHITKKAVPTTGKVDGFEQYDTVLIGFPIWYGCAPSFVNSFCEQYDFTGKKVAAFATSGGSPIGKTLEKLQPYIKNGKVLDARLFNNADKDELRRWTEKY